MAFTIAINELGDGSNKVAYVTLPANKNVVIDAMDRAKIFGEISLRISRCDEIPELVGFNFIEQPTLDELNFLAKRIDEISADKEDITPIIAYRALLRKPMDTIGEAINRTYNLQTVPVYPCKNLYAYGEIVLEGEMLEELDDIPYEIYDLLDPEKVGRAMMEREGGVFIDGYYAIADSYEPFLMYDDELPEPMDDWVFKLEVAGVPKRAEDFNIMKTEILTLPTDEEYMQDIAEALGERNIDECISMRFESAIPQIKNDSWDSMEDIYSLNMTAKKYLELSRGEAAKLKAILEYDPPHGVEKIEEIIDSLDCYEFDNSIKDYADFGEKYLEKILPPDFDRSLLKNACSASLGHKILCENDSALTEYGAVSGYGGHLFSLIEAPRQEQENNFKMGGIL